MSQKELAEIEQRCEASTCPERGLHYVGSDRQDAIALLSEVHRLRALVRDMANKAREARKVVEELMGATAKGLP